MANRWVGCQTPAEAGCRFPDLPLVVLDSAPRAPTTRESETAMADDPATWSNDPHRASRAERGLGGTVARAVGHPLAVFRVDDPTRGRACRGRRGAPANFAKGMAKNGFRFNTMIDRDAHAFGTLTPPQIAIRRARVQLRIARHGDRIRRLRHPRSRYGSPHDGLQHVDRRRRARRHDRAGRHDFQLSARPPAGPERRCLGSRRCPLATTPERRRRELRPRRNHRRRFARADDHLGHQPRHGRVR